MTLPPCEKCGHGLTDDLSCKPCRREYTWAWVVATQKGERRAYQPKA